MRASRSVLPVAFLLVAAPFRIYGQEGPPVAPGDRVRVTAPTIAPDRSVGTLVHMSADTCVLKVEGRAQPLLLPLASLERLEVGRGRKGHLGSGLAIGFLAGAVIGAIIGYADGDDPPNSMISMTADEKAILAGIGLGVLGAVIGSTVGASIKTDRWEEVPLDQIRVGPSPVNADGVALSASIRL